MYTRSWNEQWQFSETEQTVEQVYEGKVWRDVTLPHDAMISRERSADADNGHHGGFYPTATVSYRKTWIPQADSHTVMLRFGAIGDQGNVYINQTLAATSTDSYTELLVDCTPYLRADQENTVTVVARGIAQSRRWYPGSGLFRPVEMLTAGSVYILPDSVRITTQSLESTYATIMVQADITNQTNREIVAQLRLRILSPDTSVEVLHDVYSIHLAARKTTHISKQYVIQEPQLWDDHHPNQYQYQLQLCDQDADTHAKTSVQGAILDEECGRFAVRLLQVDAQSGLRINGEQIKLRGTCLHQDYGLLGAAEFESEALRRCTILKQSGFNAIRSSHQPISRAMLQACDQLGLYVIDELADVWTQSKTVGDDANNFIRTWRSRLTAMIRKDWNHPSVIVYSLGNEIPELHTTQGVMLIRTINEVAHQLDPSRYTTSAVNAIVAAGDQLLPMLSEMAEQMQGIPLQEQVRQHNSSDIDEANGMSMLLTGPFADMFATSEQVHELIHEFATSTDIAGYNYLTALHSASSQQHTVVLGSETFPADIVRLWKIVQEYDNVIGDMTWTGMDYLGEAGCGIFHYDGAANFSAHWPDRLAGIGDIDILGERKPISYLRQCVYGLSSGPFLAVRRIDRNEQDAHPTPWMWHDNIASWTWHGFEGQNATIDVIADTEQVDEIQLLLNGELVESKPLGEQYYTSFSMPYQPGELQAVALKCGVVVGTDTLCTAGTPVYLSLQEPTAQQWRSQTVVAVPIRLVDAHGKWNRQITQQVSIDVTQGGTLQAFGSANPSDTDCYTSSTSMSYDGMVMAYIRPDSSAHSIHFSLQLEDNTTQYFQFAW